MKFCPTCRNTYPDDYQTCPRDQAALTAVTNEIVPGTVLRGKYEVLCELGAGGMATVYKVRHKAFQELAAVKVVHRHFMHDPGFVKRFRNEAVVARQLKHPNAVRIDDFDYTEDERPFIVMEYVEGSSLYEVRKQHGGPWPVERCINIISQAASALSAAHTLGIVHRDIKPSNILLLRGSDGEGQVKVLDFGIAKVSENTFAGMTSVLTQQNLIIGTPEYMSPEQASGHLESTIDGRADLYSLGLVFYEMLTGAHPFQSDTPMGMLIQQLHTMPAPPDSFTVPMSAAVSALVLKALQKEPKDRFQSAGEMLDALRDPEAWYSATSKRVPVQIKAIEPVVSTSAVTSPVLPVQPATQVQPTHAAVPMGPITAAPPAMPVESPAQVPYAPVFEPVAPATSAPFPAPPPPMPVESSTPVQSAPTETAGTSVLPVRKKSNALLIVGLSLMAMLLLSIGLFYGYRVMTNRTKNTQATTPISQTPQPAQTGTSEASDVKANVEKLVAMGNDSLVNKQYDVAAEYFQQALSFNPESPEAKEGLENAHKGSVTKVADIPPAKTATDVAKDAPVVAKPKPVKAAPVHVPPATMFQALISSPEPIYPPVAKAAHLQGSVTLHAIISKTGTVKELQPISGLKIFHESALEAVQRWRYKPYLVNKEPTEVDTTITVNYTIAHK
jgi:eukaryotic-like serine/threonine-protein kinase